MTDPPGSPPIRIAIVSDACDPPTNGVTQTFTQVAERLRRRGHAVVLATPPSFATVPCPTDPGIRLAVAPYRRLARLLDEFRPDAIHLATEGPLGLAARRYCLARGYPFTTSFTTRFPEAIHARLRIPPAWGYALLRRFHRPASALMVSTASLRAELTMRGFANVAAWTRGVDTGLFRPRPEAGLPYPRPIWLYVGRVALEKSVEDFLRLPLDGTKLVVGDGPLLDTLRQRHPEARFTGTLRGEDLARHYAASDVFVFPSRTDTFGLVLLEALASGLPVAAYPVTGPLDIVGRDGPGVLDEDLGRAARAALAIPRERCREWAMSYDWETCVTRFAQLLRPIGTPRSAARQAPLAAATLREGP